MILTLIILSQLSFVLTNINVQDEYKQQGQKFQVHVAYGCVGAFYDAVAYGEKKTLTDPATCDVKGTDKPSTKSDGHFYGFKIGEEAEQFTATLDVKSRDENGDEKANATGTIKDGICKGDKFDSIIYYKVTKGKCSSDKGVTEIDTYPDGMATLKITGNCNATCVGRGQATYHRPGKKNPKLYLNKQ